MEQHFFIGSLEIVYFVSKDISHQQFDFYFCKPALPVRNTVVVNIETGRLSIPPESSIQYQLANGRSWKNGTEEFRLYFSNSGAAKISSRLSEDGQIYITILEGQEKDALLNFRPWFNIHLERLLLKNQALVLHSASIIYQGEAILFSAPSGTGKTTQADLWYRYRDGVGNLNGDRTVLQLAGDKWYACGFPIYGSTVFCAQGAYPIRAVVMLRQAKIDFIRELSSVEKLTALYSQCTVMRSFPEDVDAAMDLLESIAQSVTVVELNCTMKENAVNCLYRCLYGE